MFLRNVEPDRTAQVLDLLLYCNIISPGNYRAFRNVKFQYFPGGVSGTFDNDNGFTFIQDPAGNLYVKGAALYETICLSNPMARIGIRLTPHEMHGRVSSFVCFSPVEVKMIDRYLEAKKLYLRDNPSLRVGSMVHLSNLVFGGVPVVTEITANEYKRLSATNLPSTQRVGVVDRIDPTYPGSTTQTISVNNWPITRQVSNLGMMELQCMVGGCERSTTASNYLCFQHRSSEPQDIEDVIEFLETLLLWPELYDSDESVTATLDFRRVRLRAAVVNAREQEERAIAAEARARLSEERIQEREEIELLKALVAKHGIVDLSNIRDEADNEGENRSYIRID